MIAVRVRASRSWLSREHGRIAANEFRDRLSERCRNESGVFLTVTYDRAAWADAEQLYRASSEDQHIPLFFRRLSRLLGVSFKGRWCCKLEFQTGGWTHFHIIILGIEHIPYGDLMEAWGFGGVWIKRLTPASVNYTAKYFSKDGSVPSFLYGLRQRSVRVVRVSPGFWGGASDSACERRDKMPFYVSIGAALERAGSAVLVQCLTEGTYARARVDPVVFLAELAVISERKSVSGDHALFCDGWIRFPFVTLEDCRIVADRLGGFAAGGWGGTPGAGSPPGGGEAAALILNDTRHPDVSGQIPKWLDELFSYRLVWVDEVDASGSEFFGSDDE